MNIKLKCADCEKEFDAYIIRYTCECGGTLDVVHDLDALRKLNLKRLFDERWRVRQRAPYDSGVWRYKELIFPVEDEYIVSKPEGNTNLYDAGKAAEYAGLKNFKLKHEGENPTCSFKDRGMTCGITAARKMGAKIVACASTGNTSASMASYAATCGMVGVIFIPEGKIAFGKLTQALAYGGKTLQIRGDFDDAMALVQEVCNKMNIYLLNSINPFRIEGQKAIGFEIMQQLDWIVPDWFIMPGGNLGNNTALSKGLMELHDLGIIDKIPRIAVIQAEGANPLYTMWKKCCEYKRVENADTIATAIKIGNPVSWKKSMRGIEWSNGVVEEVTDQEIMDAKAWVDGAGIGAEPASCATVAGARKLVKAGVIDPEASVVGVLTGHLLKDPDATVNYHKSALGDRDISSNFPNAPVQIDPTLEAVQEQLSSLLSQ